jgi:hypothetical protein
VEAALAGSQSVCQCESRDEVEVHGEGSCAVHVSRSLSHASIHRLCSHAHVVVVVVIKHLLLFAVQVFMAAKNIFFNLSGVLHEFS